MPPKPLPKRGWGRPHSSGKAKVLVIVKTPTSKKAKRASKRTEASAAKLEAKLSECIFSFFLTFHHANNIFRCWPVCPPHACWQCQKVSGYLEIQQFWDNVPHCLCRHGMPRGPNETWTCFQASPCHKNLPVTCLQNEEEWWDLIKAVEEVEAKTGDVVAHIVISEKVSCFCYSKAWY